MFGLLRYYIIFPIVAFFLVVWFRLAFFGFIRWRGLREWAKKGVFEIYISGMLCSTTTFRFLRVRGNMGGDGK